MNTFQQALQEKPSQMIRYALEALEEAEAVLSYKITMSFFHLAHDGKCFMCLGGAAAIKRANKMGTSVHALSDLVGDIYTKEAYQCEGYEFALDSARIGDVQEMFVSLKRDPLEGYRFNRPITHYDANSAQFKADLHALASDLAEAGY